jgi:hypothetical protein
MIICANAFLRKELLRKHLKHLGKRALQRMFVHDMEQLLMRMPRPDQNILLTAAFLSVHKSVKSMLSL